MHPLKKYFTEGLIQVAIFLSLAGMRTDWDPYLFNPNDIHSHNSAMTKTTNLDEYSPHLKEMGADGSVTIPRLLRWVRSLEQLHIPPAQLEAWQVHSMPDNSRMTMSSLAEARDGGDDLEDSTSLTMRMGGIEAGMEESVYGAVLNESLGTVASLLRSMNSEDMNEDEDQLSLWQQELNQNVQHRQITHGNNQHFSPFNDNDEDDFMVDSWQHANPFRNQITTLQREDAQFTGLDEDISMSTEACLQLLESTFPIDEQNMADPDTALAEENPLQYHSSFLSSLLPHQDSSLDLEQQWQDVLDIVGPEDMNVDDPFDWSHLNVEGRASEPGALENPDLQNSFNQMTFPRAQQLSSTSSAPIEDNDHQNQNAANLNFNDSEIIDFLLSSAPDSSVYNHQSLAGSSIEDQSLPSLFNSLLEDATLYENNVLDLAQEEGINQSQDSPKKEQDSTDSDSGLSLDLSTSPASPSGSEFSCSSSSCSSSSASSTFSVSDEGAVGYTNIKEEPFDEEYEGAVGGYNPYQNKMLYTDLLQPEQFQHLPWLEHIGHDHTYNQPQFTSQRKPLKHHPEEPMEVTIKDRLFTRDEKRARALKIPFSTDRIINLPVEEFNELLAKHRLSEAQLALIRDIRRRGKNKVAAQNCRQKKQDILLDLECSVDDLRRHRSRLLREKSDILHSVREMKERINDLYQEVLSRRRQVQGILCSEDEFTFQQGNTMRDSESRQRSGKRRKDKK
ncbi:endoplasmic reticulum membrane sensor NFE2L1a [Trichomycterus rosablanca]|uniref:endoplasmic reticulum membrane sensor NFE2L1a n=1 Tax=Trichomycterus rosablanca TaxID=2290929 RepID=UPI002F35A149